ncbi:hypothetical protein AA313_de0205464 [Arthrobotrys entomopaga]|nr:hypothetical protein AA313_de0205464 [Arthrobotrys entomopaga]
MTVESLQGISMVVIENISLLFAKEFPPASDNPQGLPSKATPNRDVHEKQVDKRGRLVADIANRLQRFSASRMVATVVLNQLATRSVIGGGPLELGPSVNSSNHTWAHSFHHRVLLLRKHVPKTDPLMAKRHLRFVFVLKSGGIDIQNTNLSRPDQFFVIRITKNGVEDEKQQNFNAMIGVVSMIESFAASGHNSEGDYEGFSDSEEELELNGIRHRKRKRSTGGESNDEGNRHSTAEDASDNDCSPEVVDLVKIPGVPTEAGTGFPVLSQAREAQMSGSQTEQFEVPAVEPEISHKFGRTTIPDSDGESEDDVF